MSRVSCKFLNRADLASGMGPFASLPLSQKCVRNRKHKLSVVVKHSKIGMWLSTNVGRIECVFQYI